MRIGINAIPLRREGGGARFVFSSLFVELLRQDTEHEYVVFTHFLGLQIVHEIVREAAGLSRARVKVVEVNVPEEMMNWELDVIFAPFNNLQPRLYDRPTIAILHDCQEQFFPQYFRPDELIGRREDYPEICRAATVVIAISEFVKRSFIDHFGIDEKKIAVIYNAPQSGIVHTDGDGVWTGPAPPNPFIYFPANTYPHKHHDVLLDALVLLRDQGKPIHVVFTGFEMPGGFPLAKELEARELTALSQTFSNLPAQAIRYLYRHAAATVLPTAFEGFCMPAVEALACGCPVVCSDLPVLREVAGEHAIYVPVGNPAALANAIDNVRSDATLASSLRHAGPPQASRFSWERSARDVLRLFADAEQRFVGPTPPSGRPKIGVLVRLIHGGRRLVETLRSILTCGYNGLVVRALCPDGQFAAELQQAAPDLLANVRIKVVPTAPNEPVSFSQLQSFAAEESLDVATEVLEGHGVKRSFADSLAWAFGEVPEHAVLLGEVFEWDGPNFQRVCRLRLTGDGLWTLQGFLFPEMLAINVHAMAKWTEGINAVKAAGVDWRWTAVLNARRSEQLFLTRRTMADCLRSNVGVWTKLQAIRSGMYRYYRAKDGQPQRVGVGRYLEPAVRRMGKRLPDSLKARGRRIWYALVK